MAIIARQAYIDRSHMSPVEIAAVSMGGGIFRATELFYVDFNFQSPNGSKFTTSEEIHVAEEDIGDHGLCVSIGIDLLKAARASVILNIDNIDGWLESFA